MVILCFFFFNPFQLFIVKPVSLANFEPPQQMKPPWQCHINTFLLVVLPGKAGQLAWTGCSGPWLALSPIVSLFVAWRWPARPYFPLQLSLVVGTPWHFLPKQIFYCHSQPGHLCLWIWHLGPNCGLKISSLGNSPQTLSQVLYSFSWKLFWKLCLHLSLKMTHYQTVSIKTFH